MKALLPTTIGGCDAAALAGGRKLVELPSITTAVSPPAAITATGILPMESEAPTAIA